jgi:hypothetical protein
MSGSGPGGQYMPEYRECRVVSGRVTKAAVDVKTKRRPLAAPAPRGMGVFCCPFLDLSGASCGELIGNKRVLTLVVESGFPDWQNSLLL